MKKVLLLTIGGSHQPIVKSITGNKPDLVVFLCSGDTSTQKGSYTQVTDNFVLFDRAYPQKKTSLPSIPDQTNLDKEAWEVVLIKSFDDLNECYSVCMRTILEIRRKYESAEIIVDYTGGTKTMTAGLVTAALDDGNCKIVLVSGLRANLHKVTDQTEYVKVVSFYDTLAAKTLKQVDSFLERFDYSGAVSILETVIGLNLSKEREEEIQFKMNCIKGFEAWDRFDHTSAYHFLQPYRKYLVQHLIPLEQIKSALENNEIDYLIVEDMLYNAERRASQGRYEDAVGRVYRAIEFTAQVRLKKAYNQDTGNIDLSNLPTISPECEKALRKHMDADTEKIQIALKTGFELLTDLKDPVFQPWYNENKNRLLQFLTCRNNSLFAHGVQPVDESTYTKEVGAILGSLRQLLMAIYQDEKGKRKQIPQLPQELTWQSSI